jgi:hypothetical protein
MPRSSRTGELVFDLKKKFLEKFSSVSQAGTIRKEVEFPKTIGQRYINTENVLINCAQVAHITSWLRFM